MFKIKLTFYTNVHKVIFQTLCGRIIYTGLEGESLNSERI